MKFVVKPPHNTTTSFGKPVQIAAEPVEEDAEKWIWNHVCHG